MESEFEDLIEGITVGGESGLDEEVLDQDLINSLGEILLQSDIEDLANGKNSNGSEEFMSLQQDQQDVLELFPPPKLASNLSKVHKCAICNERAGKHIYYGGRACPSCRAFFRRAVTSDTYETFRCSSGKNCEMNIVTRRDCQFCRFQQCLDAGMKVTQVLTESKNKTKSQTKPSIEIEEIERNDEIEVIYPGKQQGPGLKLTEEDIMAIQLLIDLNQQLNYKRLIQFPNVGACLARFAYTGETFYTHELRMEFQGWTRENTIFKILGFTDFQSIPMCDQNELLRWNSVAVKIVNVASALEELNFGFNQDIHTITKSGEVEPYEELRRDLERLGVTNKPRIAYRNMYPSPWLPSYSDEVRHLELHMKLKSFFKPPGHDEPDAALVALGRCMVALDTEFAILRRPDLVQSLQMRYINIMRLYLLAKYQDVYQAMDQFAEAMKLSSYAREAAEIESHRLPV